MILNIIETVLCIFISIALIGTAIYEHISVSRESQRLIDRIEELKKKYPKDTKRFEKWERILRF